MKHFPFDPRTFSSIPTDTQPNMRSRQTNPDAQFRSLNASLLYCSTCKEATPTRERLLLVLPSGNKYEYICTNCGNSTGEKTDQNQQDTQLFIP